MSEVWRIGWLDISTLDAIEPSTLFLERHSFSCIEKMRN